MQKNQKFRTPEFLKFLLYARGLQGHTENQKSGNSEISFFTPSHIGVCYAIMTGSEMCGVPPPPTIAKVGLRTFLAQTPLPHQKISREMM